MIFFICCLAEYTVTFSSKTIIIIIQKRLYCVYRIDIYYSNDSFHIINYMCVLCTHIGTKYTQIEYRILSDTQKMTSIHAIVRRYTRTYIYIYIKNTYMMICDSSNQSQSHTFTLMGNWIHIYHWDVKDAMFGFVFRTMLITEIVWSSDASNKKTHSFIYVSTIDTYPLTAEPQKHTHTHIINDFSRLCGKLHVINAIIFNLMQWNEMNAFKCLLV